LASVDGEPTVSSGSSTVELVPSGAQVTSSRAAVTVILSAGPSFCRSSGASAPDVT
jgi:hypothetical protein